MKYADLLRNKNFVALWLGQVISEFGDRLAQMALIASVYYGISQGQMFRLATLLAFTIIPVFLIGPVAGVYVDKWNRKHTMLGSDILRGLLILLVPFFLIQMQSFFPIYIVVFLIFSTTRFFLPAKLGIIPDIVPKENLLLANSLTTTTGLLAAIIGLGFGGIIVELVGIRVALYIDSLSFFISALAIMLIKVPKTGVKIRESIFLHSKRIKEIEKNIFKDITNSIRYIFHQKEIPFVLKTFFILMSGIGAIYVIFIDFILKNLTVSPKMVQQLERIMGFGQFGFIIVLLGLGAFIGTILFGKMGQNIKRPRAISGGFILTGLALFLFSYATHILKNFWVTGISAILLGLASAPIIVIANTLLHEVTIEEMRGRVFSTLEIVIHLAFLIFMFLSIFLVSKLKLPAVHLLGIAGISAFIYGLLEWQRARST